MTPKGHSLASPRHLQHVSLVFSYESFKHSLLSLSADERDALTHTLTLGGAHKKIHQKTPAQIRRKNIELRTTGRKCNVLSNLSSKNTK